MALNMMTQALREQKLFISMCKVPESTAAEARELPVSVELLFQNMMTEVGASQRTKRNRGPGVVGFYPVL